jgi:hypothetical protein
MEDKVLRQLIIDELDFESSIDAANIGVAVEKASSRLVGTSQAMPRKLLPNAPFSASRA